MMDKKAVGEVRWILDFLGEGVDTETKAEQAVKTHTAYLWQRADAAIAAMTVPAAKSILEEFTKVLLGPREGTTE